MLWKSADQPRPPPESEDITKFSWVYKDGIPMPEETIAPQTLLDVVKCGCKALYNDNEGARYVDCSDLYNDVDDIGEGDGDLDDSFVVVRGASKKEI